MTSSSASSSSTAAKRGAAYETLSFDTGTASRFSLQSLFAAVKEQDRSKGDLLAQSATHARLCLPAQLTLYLCVYVCMCVCMYVCMLFVCVFVQTKQCCTS